MTLNVFRSSILAGLLLLIAGFSACAHEVSHTESDKPGWFGGSTHSETTVTQNADGTVSSESSRQTTK